MEFIIKLIALISLIYASYWDLKTREVDDKLIYFLGALAIITRLIWYFQTNDLNILILPTVSFLLASLFGYFMYKMGQWGGGDFKLIATLSFLLGYFPQDRTYFLFYFLITLLFGSIYGILYSLIYAFKKGYRFTQFYYIFLLLVPSLILFYILDGIFSILSLFIPFYFIVAKDINKIENYFIKEVSTKDLVEGDWIIEEVKYEGKIIYKPEKEGLTKKELEKLKKYNIKVKVKDGVPFVPSFLIGFLINEFFRSLLFPF